MGHAKTRGALFCGKAGELGETNGGRTALVPGSCERDTSPGFNLPELGGVREDPCEEKGGAIEG